MAEQLSEAERRVGRREATIRKRDRALERAAERLQAVERVATELVHRVVERERALRRLRAELERARETGGTGPADVVQQLAPPELDGERLRPLVSEAAEPVPAALEAEPEPAVSSNGSGSGAIGELFEGTIEVEIGPLSDFAQLVGFEDAAGGITAASEISIKRFTRGRATLAMRLKEPVALLRELEERAPFEFRVRDLRADRLVLDVDDE